MDFTTEFHRFRDHFRRGFEEGFARPVNVQQTAGYDFTSALYREYMRRFPEHIGVERGILAPGRITLRLESGETIPIDEAWTEDQEYFKSENPTFKREVSIPVGSDIWYFCPGETLIPYLRRPTDAEIMRNEIVQIDDEPTKELTDYILATLEQSWCGVKPVKRIDNPEDVLAGRSEGRYSIKKFRFECWSHIQGAQWPDDSEYIRKLGGNFEYVNNFCGYFSFPIGPLGVMQTVSILLGEDQERAKGLPDYFLDEADEVIPGSHTGWGGLLPPIVTSDDNTCRGLHVIEHLYRKVDTHLSYPAPQYPDRPATDLHEQLRYNLTGDLKWPTPGCLVFLVAKPSPLHVWFYQESSPLAYAGSFFETEFYTSGIVKKVLGSDDKNHGEVGEVLEVDVCSTSFYVRATDWCMYEVGDRVALLKKIGVQPKAFNWSEMADYKNAAKVIEETERPADQKYILLDYHVVPIEFYEEA